MSLVFVSQKKTTKSIKRIENISSGACRGMAAWDGLFGGPKPYFWYVWLFSSVKKAKKARVKYELSMFEYGFASNHCIY